MSNEFGQSKDLFSRNEGEWQRTLLILGCMIAIGIAGIGLGAYRTLSTGTPDYSTFFVSLLLAGIAGYTLHLMRPTLRTIEVCDNGMRIEDVAYPLHLRWEEIVLVEESSNGESRQLLIQKADETGYVVTEKMVERFDVLTGLLREAAAKNGIAHRTV
jgi:hypothetical protein